MEQDRKTEQASKEKEGDKVSGKTTDPNKPVDSETSRTEQAGKAKDFDGVDSSRERESSGSNKDRESDAKVSDGKGSSVTDDRKNDDRATQPASSNSKTGGGKASTRIPRNPGRLAESNSVRRS